MFVGAAARCSAGNVSEETYDGTGILVSDDFSDETFDSIDGTNTIGFQWDDGTSMYLVRMDGSTPVETCGLTGAVPGDLVTADNNASTTTADGDTRDWNADVGVCSMMFRYPGEFESDRAEVGWSCSTSRNELWMYFRWKIPVGFEFRTSGAFDKLAAVWSDGYEASGDGSTAWMIISHDGSGGCKAYISYSDGDQAGSNAELPESPGGTVLAVEADAGKWMTIAFNVKQVSANGNGDGHVGMYRKWDAGEWETLKLEENIEFKRPDSGDEGLRNGYLMGANWNPGANEGDYAVVTEFQLDRFRIATAPPAGLSV